MKKKNRITKSLLFFPLIIVVGLGAAGCATTAPHATFTRELPKMNLVDYNDSITVTVDAGSGITVAEYEKQRLSQLIKQKIDAYKENSDVSGEKRDYELNVVLTRYEKGNAFARAMLAGLGQIHIDAHVALIALPERENLSEFNISKTFAWGGIYGSSTRIEDIEPVFAEGVAKAVTKANKQQEQPQEEP